MELAAWASVLSLLVGVIVGIVICRLPEFLDGLEGSNGG